MICELLNQQKTATRLERWDNDRSGYNLSLNFVPSSRIYRAAAERAKSACESRRAVAREKKNSVASPRLLCYKNSPSLF
jgi:hypothetical protein